MYRKTYRDLAGRVQGILATAGFAVCTVSRWVCRAVALPQNVKLGALAGLTFGGVLMATMVSLSPAAHAATGINPELSFEGKVVTAAGINIPDGNYNVEFKIYTGCTNNTGTGCTTAWTEDWLVGSSPVTFSSGTFQVNLGTTCAFTGGTCQGNTNTAINWNTNPLYLSIQMGNTSTCTTVPPAGAFTADCGGDTVMTPYVLLTATPYAFNSGQLGGLTASQFGQLAANQTWTGTNTFQPATNITSLIVQQTSVGSPTADIFDIQTANASNILQVTGPSANASNVALNAVGSNNSLTLNAAGTGTATLDNTGTASNVQIGNTTGSVAQTINIGNNATTSSTENVTIGSLLGSSNTTIQGGGGSINITTNQNSAPSVIIQTNTNTSNALLVRNSSGLQALTINTVAEGTTSSNEQITLGNITSTAGKGIAGQMTFADGSSDNFSATLTGNGTSTDGVYYTGYRSIVIPDVSGTMFVLQGSSPGTAQSGNYNISGTGIAGALQAGSLDTASSGTLTIGPTNATTVQVGSTTSSGTQTISIGSNATGGSITAISVGSTLATTTATIQAGATSESLGNSGDVIKTSTNSTTAFQIQNASATPVEFVDTTNTNLVTTSSINGIIATNWTAKNTATVTGDTTTPFGGLSSIKAASIAANSGAQTSSFTSALTASTAYQITFEIKCSVAEATGITMGITISGVDTVENSTLACTTGWTQDTLHFTTPSGTAPSAIFIDSGAITSLNMWFDQIQLVQTATSAATDYAPGHIYLEGEVINPAIFQNQANSALAFQVQNAAGTNMFHIDNTADVVQVGSQTANANDIVLGLNNYNAFTDPSANSTCASTTDLGGLYYNTVSSSVRACVNGSWQDLLSTGSLGLIAFGVVSNSGTLANQGDLPALITAGVTGPCKVSWASTTTVTVAPCQAYSGGRLVTVSSTTLTLTTTITNLYENVCLTGTNGQPALVGPFATQNSATIEPAFSASAPVLCLATLKNSSTVNGNFTGTAQGQIYDTRTFTDTAKEYDVSAAAMGMGYLAQVSGVGVTTSTALAGTVNQEGVVVATNGSTSSTSPNVIIATAGPAEVVATSGTAGANYVESSGTAGFAQTTGTALTTAYWTLGLSRTTTVATCTSASTCIGSIFVNIDIK